MRSRAACLVLILGALTLALSGCLFDIDAPFPGLPDWGGDDEGVLLELLSAPGVIHRPQVGQRGTWRVQPYTKVKVLFETARDQYGNPTGLSDDRLWSITDVTIRCELKGEDDTVYTPGDPMRHDGFYADGRKNACVWFPLYTGKMAAIVDLPYSPYPLAGYPFDACQNVGTTAYPEQRATITARARVDHIRIRITVPEHEDGIYILDLPGATPQESHIFELGVGEHGPIEVIWESDGAREVYTVEIPVDWFWITGRWLIPVAGSAGC
jgi:hypothetical protein